MGAHVAFIAAAITARVPRILAVPSPGVGKPPPGAGKFTLLLQWGAWLACAACVAGAIYCGAKMALEHAHNRGGGEKGKDLGWVLAGCIVVAVAAPLVTALVT